MTRSPRVARARCMGVSVVVSSVCVALAIVASAHAEVWGGASVPIQFRAWTVKESGRETKVSQFYAPITARLVLRPGVDLVIAAGGADSHVGTSAAGAGLNGIAAIQSQLQARLLDRRLLLQAGLTLPSGNRALDARQQGVAQVLSLPVLGLPLKQLGRGLEGGGGASLAMSLSPSIVASAGIGGVIRGPYELIAGQDDFRPAPELAVTTGADLGQPTDGAGRPLRVDLTYRAFGNDEQSGHPVFKEGAQLEMQAQGQRGGDGFRSYGSLRAVLKADNSAMGPAGSTLGALKASSGNGATARLRGDRPLGSSVRVGFDGEWNRVWGSDSFGRNGQAFGLGPIMDWSLANGLGIGLDAMILWGSLKAASGGTDMDLRGASISAMLRWRPRS